MRQKSKWLVRAGGFLLITGFLLLYMAVSFEAFTETSGTIGLFQITPKLMISLLWMVLLFNATLLVLSFFPAQSLERKKGYFWGQVGSLLLSISIYLFFAFTIQNQPRLFTQGFPSQPQIGCIALPTGYIIAVCGLIIKVPMVFGKEVEKHEGAKEVETYKLKTIPVLEISKGMQPQTRVPITHDQFLIGRGSESDLTLKDVSVSRKHAIMRFGDGTWFIQDLSSKTGILVNRKRVTAARLKNGDRITIGEQTFTFRKSE